VPRKTVLVLPGTRPQYKPKVRLFALPRKSRGVIEIRAPAVDVNHPTYSAFITCPAADFIGYFQQNRVDFF